MIISSDKKRSSKLVKNDKNLNISNLLEEDKLELSVDMREPPNSSRASAKVDINYITQLLKDKQIT